jgi:hypothetical protein
MRTHERIAGALALSAGLLLASPAGAGEWPKPPERPATAADADAAAAVETFKTEFRAKGLTGDDRTSQRDFAMRQVSKVQHKAVVEQLATVTRNPDETLRILAVYYLGQQAALPGPAGSAVAAAMQKNADDAVLLMSGLQAIGRVRYLGGRDTIRAMLKHPNYAIKKTAIAAIGETGDLRLLEDMLLAIGFALASDTKDAESNSKEEVTEGYSWEGASASVDTGTAGDGDQKAAEAKAKAEMAANKAAAEAAHAGKSGGDGGEGKSGGGGAKRTVQELIPAVVAALQKMTGEAFSGPPAVRKWARAKAAEIAERKAALDEAEKAQKAQGK